MCGCVCVCVPPRPGGGALTARAVAAGQGVGAAKVLKRICAAGAAQREVAVQDGESVALRRSGEAAPAHRVSAPRLKTAGVVQHACLAREGGYTMRVARATAPFGTRGRGGAAVPQRRGPRNCSVQVERAGSVRRILEPHVPAPAHRAVRLGLAQVQVCAHVVVEAFLAYVVALSAENARLLPRACLAHEALGERRGALWEPGDRHFPGLHLPRLSPTL